MSNFDITILSAISVNLFNRIYFLLFVFIIFLIKFITLFFCLFVCLPRTNRVNITEELKKNKFPEKKNMSCLCNRILVVAEKWGPIYDFDNIVMELIALST